jgi:cytochrome c nitrite reductase small subunit
MTSHFRATPAALAASALVGILLGAGGYTVYFSEASAYLGNDPRACVKCHIMRDHYDGWQKASHHAAATCNDCHVPHEIVRKYASKAANGFWHSKGFTLQDFHEPIRIRPVNREVVNHNCVQCHAALVSEISREEINCIQCHSAVGHGPTR